MTVRGEGPVKRVVIVGMARYLFEVVEPVLKLESLHRPAAIVSAASGIGCGLRVSRFPLSG
jgi:hypothetical protein